MTLDNYANLMVEDIKSAIRSEVKKDAEIALINAINNTVYLQKKRYRPTYNLLDAVEIMDLKIGRTKATFRIGINASRLIPNPQRPWNWDSHSDIHGKPFQEGLVQVLDQGYGRKDGTVNTGRQAGRGFYNHPAHRFFDKAYDDVEENMVHTLAKSLRAKGWKVEVY